MKSSSNNTILITGGLGYIGGRLARHLADSANGWNIRILTRHSGSVPKWAKGFDIVYGDVLDEPSLDKAVKGVDVIIHLAAVNEIESSKNPKLALDVNGWGTYNVLAAAQKNSVKKFIYFSTFHVYGLNAIGTITESTAARPVTSYAISHLAAEGFVDYFRRNHQMETLIFRLSNPYGYPMNPEVDRWTLVFNDLCLQAVKKKKIILKSSGKQYRDFVSLNDVMRATEHMLLQPYECWKDGLFNLGGNCQMTIAQVAEKVREAYEKVYGRKIPVEIPPDKDGDAVNKPIIYDTNKLKCVGFVPNNFDDNEIRKTFEICEMIKI